MVWCVSFIAVIWRYGGPAAEGTEPFLIGTGVALCILQVFSVLMLCLFKWISNPPFGFCWVYLSLVFTAFAIHIAVLGADLARLTLASSTVPYNTVEYDICIVVTQAIFIVGVFCLSFNAGSHRAPPVWAHPKRSSRYRHTGLSDRLGEGSEYAAAGDLDLDTVHSIGQLDNDE